MVYLIRSLLLTLVAGIVLTASDFEIVVEVIEEVLQDATLDFSYDGATGPEYWPQLFKQSGGKLQSPVRLSSTFVKKSQYPSLQFRGFNQQLTRSVLSNTGHTVKLQIDDPVNTYVHGGPLKGRYQFEQLHFHWGKSDKDGSEHVLNGQSFAAELHMVLWNRKYDTIATASRHHDGLAVLAVFLELSKFDNQAFNFVKLLERVLQPGARTHYTDPHKLQDLLPRLTEHYYTMGGSLTTPPCSEVVTWIIFKDTVQISRSQLQKFRTLLNKQGQPIRHNRRPTQALNDRKVYYNAAA